MTAAVGSTGRHFESLVVLGAEIAFDRGEPRVVRVPPDFAALRSTGRPVGLALRVGPFTGPFTTNDPVARVLATTARELVEDSRRASLEPAELQLDFDCAERRLDGYRTWLLGLRQALGSTPLTITVLPSWLKQRSFGDLARATDGFVLQVHSLARPRAVGEAIRLCDPVAARRWVEAAGRVGVPFRVALPTYGYLVAFGADGTYLGASAEGPPPERPAGTQLRELSADPTALAQLVADWRHDRPVGLRGLIWYRLPVAGEHLNWRWPTLASVMAGRAPMEQLTAAIRRPQAGLAEVELRNAGTADHRGPVEVRARWTNAALVAADGIRGFTTHAVRPGEMLFTHPTCRLPAGDAVTIGWVRLDSEAPITVATDPGPRPAPVP